MQTKVKEREHTTLASSLKMGQVHLNVQDLQNMQNFYQHIIGLHVLKEEQDRVTLGFEKTPIITLIHTKDLPVARHSDAGLYHTAIVFASRGELARTIYRIIKNTPMLYTGSGDHLVSEAFYLNDPEGNGVELYFDREATSWQWVDNQIKMDTIYIDLQEYLQKHINNQDPHDIKVGHVHLKVGDIEKAKDFYVDTLGFDQTAKLPGALFVSIGGYHHHIGMNTWESSGAESRRDTLGLQRLELILPSLDDVMRLENRLREKHIEYKKIDNSLLFFDPWKNEIHVLSE
jgi:catechol 2,3-dioxygenase